MKDKYVTREELIEALHKAEAQDGLMTTIQSVIGSLSYDPSSETDDGFLITNHCLDDVLYRASPNISAGTNDPRHIIMHYTAGGSIGGTISHFLDGNNKVSSHVVISRDGGIFQMVDFNKIAWHAGRSEWNGLQNLNKYSIGVELCNWGWLTRDSEGNWRSHTGTIIPESNVFVGSHKNSARNLKGWEVYPQIQLDTAAAVVASIRKEYGIHINKILGHDDIAPRRKFDPGPAFNMEKFRNDVLRNS